MLQLIVGHTVKIFAAVGSIVHFDLSAIDVTAGDWGGLANAKFYYFKTH